MINIEKSESIGYQSSIEKGFDVLKHGTHDQSSHGRRGGGSSRGYVPGGGKDPLTKEILTAKQNFHLLSVRENEFILKNGDGEETKVKRFIDIKNNFPKFDIFLHETSGKGVGFDINKLAWLESGNFEHVGKVDGYFKMNSQTRKLEQVK